ncbi:MAG: S41 family peptidase [Gammaproteobacteria bacterium]
MNTNSKRRQSLVLIFSAAVVVLAGCGGGGGGDSGIAGPDVSSCSVTGQNAFVFDLMNDIYFWIDDVPAVTNSGFASPEAVLEAFRFAPLDRFSGLRDREENDAFFSDSQFIGLGFGITVVDDTRLRLTQVFGDGPAAAVGMARGDEITRIDGRAVSDILASDGLGGAFGASEEGVTVSLEYIDGAGSTLQTQLTKGLVTIETVTRVTDFDLNGRRVGYLSFRSFVEPSFAALDTAFNQLQAANVESLVLDLRYNGGGLISVAEELASKVGGSSTTGQVFAQRVHNAANQNRNVTTGFSNPPNALNLTDVVVITTGSTASASEMVINALRPFVPVSIVGSRSFGKPVGSYQFEFCDKVAVPIAFSLVNADGDGDFFDGFTPDCEAADDLDNPLGDQAEASFAEAIFLIENGMCSPVSRLDATSSQKQRAKATARGVQHELGEWRQTLNAF